MADFRVQAQDLAAKASELRSLKDNLQAKCGEYYDKVSTCFQLRR